MSDPNKWYGAFDPSWEILAEVEDRGSWEGSGVALARDGSNQYHTASYSHCSCDGPEETLNTGGPFEQLEDALRWFGQSDRATIEANLPK